MPTFNDAVRRLSPPPIPSVQRWARDYDGSRGPRVDLSQAVPGYPPHERMLHCLAQTAGSAAYAGYGDIEGEPDLRQAYADQVGEVYGADIGAGNVHITAGCNQAFVATVMAIAAAGDSVLLVSPFYFNHDTSLAMLGIRTEVVASHAEHGFVPDPQDIVKAIHPGVRAVVLITPNNPTGAIYPADVLEDIYEICRHHGIWLLVDETYRDFLPRGGETPHELLCMPGWEETLIQLYSFSKSFCIPGHRLGAVTAGEPVVAQIAKVMDNLQICAPRAAQAAVAKAMPALTDWREANRETIHQRADVFRTVMTQVPAWQVAAVGAYFAYVRHPFNSQSSATVAERLARTAGVLTLPGEYFGVGQERFLRMAFANADADTIRLLAGRLGCFQ